VNVPAGVTTLPPFTIVSNFTDGRFELGAGRDARVAGGLPVVFLPIQILTEPIA
jgi:hypothetical protein